MEEETGKYYTDCAVVAAAPQGEDKKQAKKLWEVSKGIVADITPLKPSGTGAAANQRNFSMSQACEAHKGQVVSVIGAVVDVKRFSTP